MKGQNGNFIDAIRTSWNHFLDIALIFGFWTYSSGQMYSKVQPQLWSPISLWFLSKPFLIHVIVNQILINSKTADYKRSTKPLLTECGLFYLKNSFTVCCSNLTVFIQTFCRLLYTLDQSCHFISFCIGQYNLSQINSQQGNKHPLTLSAHLLFSICHTWLKYRPCLLGWN